MVEVTLTKMKGASLLLDGYITRGKPTQRFYNGKIYHIVHYQGKHANEFAIYETKNGVYDGIAELYKDGMLKIRWEMKNGKRDGLYVQYKKGLVIKKGRWKDVGADVVEERWVENKPGSIRMIITSFGKTVFVGGFDDKLEKNGYGIEFNPDGTPNKSGIYRHDQLVWLHQRIDSPSEMTEFTLFPTHNGDEYVEQDDCVFMRPEYTGSYFYNEDANTIRRDGTGYLIDKQTGCCIAKSEWEKGVEIESKRVPLYDGWYCMTESPPSLRRVAEMEEGDASPPQFLHSFDANGPQNSSSYDPIVDEFVLNHPEGKPSGLEATDREPFVLPPRPTSTPFSIPSNGPKSNVFYSHPEAPYHEQSPLLGPQLPPYFSLPSVSSPQKPSTLRSPASGVGRVLEPFTDFDLLPVPMEPIEPEKETKEKVVKEKVVKEKMVKEKMVKEKMVKEKPKAKEREVKELETKQETKQDTKQETKKDTKPETKPDIEPAADATAADPFVFPSVLIPNVTTIETMVMPPRSFSKQSYTLIQMSDISTLKHITIGEDSFANVRTFNLSNLKSLQSVKIGKRCCTLSKESPVQECVEGRFSVINCPKLKTVFVGELAFSDYHFLDLTNLPALTTLTIAAVCFKYGTYFELKSLPQLVKVRMDDYAFQYCQKVVLEDLPSLQAVILGTATLECDGRDDRKSITMAPYSFFNTISMKNLPSLNQLTGRGGNLSCVGTIELANIPLLEESGIDFAEPAFEWAVYLHSQDAPGLEAYIDQNCPNLI